MLLAKPNVQCSASWRSMKATLGRDGLRENAVEGAYGKTAVFGIFERAGQVYTEVVSDCSKATLQGIIRGRVDPASVVNSDGWRGYNGLVDLGYGHYRVDHSKDEFARGRVHINGIEGFWGLAKQTFHLHLKETEWRYNHRSADKPKLLLSYLWENPLS